MANIKVCTRCKKIKLDQYNFYVSWKSWSSKYLYSSWCIECDRTNHKKWYKKNKRIVRKWNQKHSVELKAYGIKWRKNNKNKLYENQKRYNSKHRDERRAHKKRRRIAKKGINGSHTLTDMKFLYKYQQGKCACCNKEILFNELTEDHIIPLSWGGSNYRQNIQLLCMTCNSSKGAYHATDYRDSAPIYPNSSKLSSSRYSTIIISTLGLKHQ